MGSPARLFSMLAAVLVLALAAAAPAAADYDEVSPAPPRTAAAQVPDGFFAVNADALRPGVLPPEARRRHLNLMRSGGLAAIRMDVLWNDVQPQRSPGPDYSAYDPVVADAARRGITVNPVLAYGTSWASGLLPGATAEQRRKSPPADVALYVRYAGTLARRYGRGGTFWRDNPGLPYHPVTTYEVWNEPNSAPYWRPGPDPAGYAALFAAAATAIRSLDPSAVVVVGGLVSQHPRPWVMDPRDFVTGMLAARPDLRDVIGAVGLHAYAPTAAGTLDDVDELRATLDALGVRAPIALDEWGASTAGPGALADAARAALYTDTMALLAARRGELLYSAPYAWATDELDATAVESFFGIVPPQAAPGLDPVPSLTGTAFLDAVRRYQGQGPQPAADPPPADAMAPTDPPPPAEVAGVPAAQLLAAAPASTTAQATVKSAAAAAARRAKQRRAKARAAAIRRAAVRRAAARHARGR